MKNRNIIYLMELVCLLTLTSCVSYETTVSSQSKNYNYRSNRYTYNIPSKKHNINYKNKRSGSVVLKSDNPKTVKISNVKLVLKEAEKYKGTPYKYGGSTLSGIDCSGLVCNAYLKIDVKLPRRSIDMSNQGSSVSLSNIKEGDLLFFNTGGNSINHVGIVNKVDNSGKITFIHASTSKGVIVSSLEESYWNGKFKKARRIL